MFRGEEFYIIFLPAVGLIILVRILIWHFNKKATPRERLLNSLKGGLIIWGILIASLWLAMPESFDFKMYDYPKEFKSLEEVHAYLKEQSNQLAKLTEVIKFFFFIFVVGFLQNIYGFVKALIGEDIKSNADGLS